LQLYRNPVAFGKVVASLATGRCFDSVRAPCLDG